MPLSCTSMNRWIRYALHMLDHIVNACGQSSDVRRFHRREHADTQLVAPQLAVSGAVDDAVLSQNGKHLTCRNLLVQINSDHCA